MTSTTNQVMFIRKLGQNWPTYRLTKNDLNGFPVPSLEESSGRNNGGWHWPVDGIAYRSGQDTDTYDMEWRADRGCWVSLHRCTGLGMQPLKCYNRWGIWHGCWPNVLWAVLVNLSDFTTQGPPQ